MIPPDREPCPACGGAGGGPFGRANSGWDIESYECVRCGGWGYVRQPEELAAREDLEMEPPPIARPGIAKVPPERLPVETPEPATRTNRKSG